MRRRLAERSLPIECATRQLDLENRPDLFGRGAEIEFGDQLARLEVGGVIPSWATDGTPRCTQVEMMLSRSARRCRDPSRTASTISGGDVKGVPPGNGGAGSY